MSTFTAAMFVLVSSLCWTLQAAAQPDVRGHPHLHVSRPYAALSAGRYQPWVSLNLAGYANISNGLATEGQGPNPDADIAGRWISEALPGFILTLQNDGSFAVATVADIDRRCASGVERGHWAVVAETAQLLFRIKTDTNGKCGLSDPQMSMMIRKTGAGTLTFGSIENSQGNLPFVRTKP